MKRHTHALKACVFDMDGTLTLPGAIDFKAMRSRCGVPPGVDILAHVDSLEEPHRSAAHAILVEEEEAGLRRMQLRHDCVDMFKTLKAMGVARGLLTRNNCAAMAQTLELLGDPSAFTSPDVMLSRKFTPAKPFPDALHHIAKQLGISTAEMCMVGDSIDDIACGVSAGAVAILIGEEDCAYYREAAPHAHHTIRNLAELPGLLHELGCAPHHAHAHEVAGAAGAAGQQ